MRPILMSLTAAALLSPHGADAQEWTTAYASLARTSYLAGEPVAPPFAVAWEYRAKDALLCAPLIAMDRAYVTTRGFLVSSLDLAKGTVIWAFEGPRGPDEVISFDALTGKIRWRERVDGNVVHTPQIGHMVVYVGTAAGTLYAFNQHEGKLMWSARLGAPLTIAAVDATLLVIGAGPALVGLNPATGATVFRIDMGEPPAFFPVLAPTAIYCPLPKAVVALDRTGKELWRSSFAKPLSSPLAVTKDGVLAGCVDGTVRLIGLADGSARWEEILAGTPTALSGTADTVYVGTKQGTLVGLALSTGAKLWSAALGNGAVSGVALAGGHLLVTAGSWLGTLLPAPAAPAGVGLRKEGKRGLVSWETVAGNGSPISAYRIWRRRGATVSLAGTVPAGVLVFTDDLLAGEAAYAVSAVGSNSAESARSGEVTLVKGEPILRRLAVAPLPYDPRVGALAITFELTAGARVEWSIADAEGQAVTDVATVLLPKGPAALAWSGTDRAGRTVERGTLNVVLRASAEGDTDTASRTFPVEWGAGDGPAVTPAAGPAGGAAPGEGGTSAASGGDGSSPGDGASGGSGTAGKGGKGVRDHGKGEGRDGAGQGKGQGYDKR